MQTRQRFLKFLGLTYTREKPVTVCVLEGKHNVEKQAQNKLSYKNIARISSYS